MKTPPKSRKQLSAQARGLRVTDQETARVTAVRDTATRRIVGAGCLLSDTEVLTCYHVVKNAIGRKPKNGDEVILTLTGVSGQPELKATVKRLGNEDDVANDLAILRLPPTQDFSLAVPRIEFAAPLRHSGKLFSVLGFPQGSGEEGRSAIGRLHAADAKGLVQMDKGGQVGVEQGYSGAPVWCPDVGAFVGIVVTEQKSRDLSWCIPSKILCAFHPSLLVRFRIPPIDRPKIHDYKLDDPNVQLFGSIDRVQGRRLKATVRGKKSDGYVVQLRYECETNSPPPRGGYVTFITYPDFEDEDREDAYELFSLIENGVAENEIYPHYLFTVAAVGDAGETALTLDLEQIRKRRKHRH